MAPYFTAGKAGYYLYGVDAAGYPENLGELAALTDVVRNGAFTDVIVLAHGYFTAKERDGSLGFGTGVVERMEETRPQGLTPLYVAVHWPSKPITLFGGEGKGAEEAFENRFKEEGKRDLAGSSSAAPRGLLDAESLVHAGAEPEAATALSKVSKKVASDGPSSLVAAGGVVGAENVSKHVRADLEDLSKRLSPEFAQAPTDDHKPLLVDRPGSSASDPKHFVESCLNSCARSVQSGVDSATETGTRYFNSALVDITFGQFARRASAVGSRAVHALLADLMKVSDPSVKFHLFGHSLGGHVASSACIGSRPRSLLSRKVHTLMIAQGALDAASFSEGGDYRPIVKHLQPVAGPILATTSPFDGALKGYKMFLANPLGIKGVKDPSPSPSSVVVLKPRVVGEEPQKFTFKGGHFYTLDGQHVITERSGGLIDLEGAHGDILDDETMTAFWTAATTKVRGGVDAYKFPPKLPKGFWDNYDVRGENDWRCCMM